MIIHDMFTDFCVVDKLDLDLLVISNYCYDKEKTESGNIISNVGGWQSSNIINDPFEFIGCLEREVLNRIKKISDDVGFNKNAQYKINNMWININRKNNYNLLHDHPGSIFAGTFYVKSSKNCGNLTFCSSRKKSWCLEQMIDENFTPYNSQTYKIVPEENNLVLFMSSMDHYVESNLSNDDRISISFNVGIK